MALALGSFSLGMPAVHQALAGGHGLSGGSSAEASASVLETPSIRFQISPESGRYEIRDKQTGVLWQSNPYHARFGEVSLRAGTKTTNVELVHGHARQATGGLEIDFHPLPDRPSAMLRVQITPQEDGRTLEFTYAADGELEVESVRLLDDALWTTDAARGYVVVPVRMGLLIPADSKLKFTHVFDTYAYEGCHMEMVGIIKDGAMALLTWDDPYVAAEVKSDFPQPAPDNGQQVLSTSLVLRKSARSFRAWFGGEGDYVGLARHYRELAKQKGLLVTWEEKLKTNPERAKLFGAINYKLWALLQREMNEESTKEEVLKVHWTFDEAAQVAEHLKNDLKLDKVLFTLGGWSHRGYDNQHPDVLPAAPECGGNDGLAACARRILALGYLLCLHDNYQDIYRDSPSWSEDLIMKHPDGSLAKGGRWWGGRAYLICSRKAPDLAKRPQNLPAVKELTRANSYFIDTTYASDLQECFDPSHPLTRSDDMKGKQALSDYARATFGIFGSEDGREWAIPHSDFFEGLTGVSGRHFHDEKLMSEVGGVSVPLFEIVYRDAIALYGKYEYDIFKSADYVLYHLSIGRPLNYHEIPAHLYWKEAVSSQEESESSQPAAVFTRADGGWAEGLHPLDRFVKNTYEVLSPLYEITARMPLTQHEFLTADRRVQRTVFGDGPEAVIAVVNAGENRYTWRSKTSGRVELPPQGFLVDSPGFVAFHALSYNGISYNSASLFTLRSLDGEALANAKRIRVFHGFGDARVKVGHRVVTVRKEAVLEGQ
jgi:hypothetical protein